MSEVRDPAAPTAAAALDTTAEPAPAVRRRRPGDLPPRLLRHYLPITVASTIALVVFMNVSYFNANRYPPPADIMVEGLSGAIGPQGGTPMGPGPHEAEETASTPSGSAQPEAPTQHGGATPGGSGNSPLQHGGGSTDQASTPSPSDGEDAAADHEGSGGREQLMRKYSTVTGYIALVLLALTLLVGPASLMRRRQTPLSSYLTRDVGIMAATVSIAHLIFGFLTDHGDGILGYFFEPGDRTRILTTSFGLANWTGLSAVVVVAALAAISSDRALRSLKARRWKRIQRLNYVLFPLVIAHAVLYGALLRITSPYTALLGVSAVAVLAGQLIGIRLWRRRRATD